MQATAYRRDAEAQRINAITEKIVGCAIEVHRALGPGYWSQLKRSALVTRCDVVD
jgi:hypothetical protein